MYAIIKSGAKQYRVAKESIIDVELLKSTKDNEIEFTEVLLLNQDGDVKIGAPNLPNCVVKGVFLEEVKGPKVIAFKYKRRKGYRRKVGHRQKYSRVKITEIIS